MALLLGLLAATCLHAPLGLNACAPPMPGSQDGDGHWPIGLEFGVSIPAHDRAPLQDSFEKTLPLACARASPCVENCPANVSTIGVALDGSDRNYTLHWVTTDPRLDEPLIVESSCELCSLVELEQQFAVDLAHLCSSLEALDAGPGRLEVSSDPSEARLRIDGQEVGRTPWSGELAAGEHTVELRALGYRPLRHSVAITGNIEAHKHFSLISSFARRGRPTWPGWTSLGLGIAMSVAGTALISIDGQPWARRCTGNDIDVAGNCRFVLATRPLGISLASLGAGAIAGGVGLLVWAQRDPAQTSAGLSVGGHF